MSDFKDINIDINKTQAQVWLKEQLSTYKIKPSESLNNSKHIGIILKNIKTIHQLDILLERGFVFNSKLFNSFFSLVCSEISHSNKLPPKKIMILNKLIDIKNKDPSIDICYDSLFYSISYSTGLARRLKKLDVDWATICNSSTGKSKDPYLYNLPCSSANILLKSKNNFKSMNSSEKNDFLYKMATRSFSALSNSIIKNTNASKRSHNDLLNTIMGMLDDKYLQKFVKEHEEFSPSFKIKKDYTFDSESKEWTFNNINNTSKQPLGMSKSNLLKIKRKKNRSLKDIEFLKNYGVDFSHPNSSIYLLGAIWAGNLKVCNYLIECGANLSYLNDKKINSNIRPAAPSILHVCLNASYEGKTSIIKFLISQGEDVSLSNNKGETPLFKAVRNKDIPTIKLLLESGADVNHKDKLDQNVLYHLSLNSSYLPTMNIEVVEFLVKNGLDPFHTSSITNKTFIESMDENFSPNPWQNNIKEELDTLSDFLVSLSSHQIKKHANPSTTKKKRKLF